MALALTFITWLGAVPLVRLLSFSLRPIPPDLTHAGIDIALLERRTNQKEKSLMGLQHWSVGYTFEG
jgi:hypothetical protein